MVYEALLDDERRHNAQGLLASLNILVDTADGSDFTGAECRAWMREAGIRETDVEPLAGPESMVAATKEPPRNARPRKASHGDSSPGSKRQPPVELVT